MEFRITDSQHRILVVGLALLSVVLLSCLRFCGGFELPDRPPRPKLGVASARAIQRLVDKSASAYRIDIEDDAAALGLGAGAIRAMAGVFPHHVDGKRRTLSKGKLIKVLDLSLRWQAERIPGSKRMHMVLTIQNHWSTPVAYRVETIPSSGQRACLRAVQIPHNAIAMLPRGATKRVECTYEKGRKLIITRVEVMELPELGYYYVSSLPAGELGLDERVMKNHVVPVESMTCGRAIPRAVTAVMKTSQVVWRDIIDFYARHHCKRYSYYEGYSAFVRHGERNLPAIEPKP